MGVLELTKFLMVLEPMDGFNPLASERALLEMLNSLDERWEAHFLISRPVSYRRLPCKHVIHVVPFGTRPKSPIFKLLYIVASLIVGIRVVRRYGIYFTACKGGHLHLGVAAYLIARLTNRKCLIRVNENAVLALTIFLKRSGFPGFLTSALGKIARRIEASLFGLVDVVITHGPDDYERIRRLVGDEKVFFVPLGVDLSRFRKLPPDKVMIAKTKLMGDQEKRAILFVGRLHPEKGLPTLLKAFKLLLSTHPGLVLLIIGWGVDKGRYERLAEALGIADSVVFLGFIPHEELPIYYNMADVYVLSSLYEEWSNTIMEAMACGVPVVATAVGANPWLVKDSETGFLVPPCRPDLLAKRISAILDDPQLAKRMAENARKLVRKYDIRASGQSYRRIMLKLACAYKDPR